MQTLPSTGLLRLTQIIGKKATGTHALIPVGKTTWWTGVKAGRYPQPVKIGERAVAWRVEDIRALISDGVTGDPE